MKGLKGNPYLNMANSNCQTYEVLSPCEAALSIAHAHITHSTHFCNVLQSPLEK